MIKRILFLLALSLLLVGCGQQQAVEETTQPTYSAEFLEAEEIGASGYLCVTGESGMEEAASRGTAVAVKAFSHRIYGPQGDYVLTLTTTVIVSADAVSSVSASLSDAQKDGFTTSEHVSKDTGTVILYLNQLSVCHFQYRLQEDGTISFL